MTDTLDDTRPTTPTEAGRRPPLRRWWTTVLVCCLAALLVAELAVRGLSSHLGEPLVWYSMSMQNKAVPLEESPQEPAETVFVGSSAVAAALDPGIYRSECDARAYNGATNGAVPTMVSDWLDRVLIPRLDPRVVVLGISPRDFAVSSTGSADQHFRSVAVRDDLGARADRWVSSWSYLVRYRSILRSPQRLKARVDEARGVSGEQWIYDADGFERREADGTDTTEQKDGPGMEVAAEQVQAYDRMVGHLLDRGITPVVAQMGYSERWSSTPRAAALADRTATELERIARRHGVPMVDLREVSSPDQFVDLVHTDAGGSATETRLLIDALRGAGVACGAGEGGS